MPVNGTLHTEKTSDQMRDRTPQGEMSLEEIFFIMGSLKCANGGNLLNPMGFPDYLQGYGAGYRTYRFMLQHPMIRLVRSICVGIIAASSWEYEATTVVGGERTVPQRWLNLAQYNFDKLRPSLMWDFFVRGRDFGWSGGELIWKNDDNRMVIDRIKPLYHDMTDIQTDKHGNFTGLVNRVPNTDGIDPEVKLPAPYKAWKFTFDGEAGYHYGRSWLENIRTTAWKDWLDAMQQIQRLGAKIAGVVTVITSPAGTFPGPPDAEGKETRISYRENAEKAIKALAAGASGVWFPSLGLFPDTKGNLDAAKVLSELAGKSLTQVDVKDFGNQSQAITPILERVRHAEELMFAGGLRSSRTGMEGKHGTKEEAGVHTDTGTINAEAEDEDFARQCQPLVDALMEVNFGSRAVGRVRIKPASLVDRRTQILRAILMSVLNDTDVKKEIAATIDVDNILKTLHVALKKPFDPTALFQKSPPPPRERNQPNPEGGRPEGENNEQ